MDTIEIEPRRRKHVALVCFSAAVLVALLLVGTGVEVAYYRASVETVAGIEKQRDAVKAANNNLHNIVIKKLDEQTELLKEQIKALDELEKEVHRNR